MLRIVADTNVIVSAIATRRASPPRAIYQAILDGRLQLITSAEIMEELEEVLKREEVAAFHKRTPEQIEQIVDALATVSEFVAGQVSVSVVVEDHDDDKFLAAALEGRADYIISGDRHLFGLGQFQGIPILLPRVFVDTVL